MKRSRPGRLFFFFFCFVFPALLAPEETVSIASFNIQTFGVSKMRKGEVVKALADIVSRCDIIAIQEVRSATADPVEKFMASIPERYNWFLGPREGRTISKEQYWVIYDSQKFSLLGSDTYPDPDDVFERNPLAVFFAAREGFKFILINNHLKPSDVQNEINALGKVVCYYQELWEEEDVLVVGDFNADGFYYSEELLAEAFPEPHYYSIIGNDADTTVASSQNTYDRFVITKSAVEDFTGSWRVLRFEDEFDFSVLDIEPREISDHYPVIADFYTRRDTD
ncbi:MAG: endonuclease/exonuclease/phosphatase family protein [Treponema sp.]|nr:endonuclease/exonuclease/phosphatase family protein [Treponema sp.]